MRLTHFTDYTLRVLIYLGLNQSRLVTIDEIANAYDISRNHLMKIVHQQARVGVIKTIRGKGGGMQLGKIPDKICIGDIVRNTEQNMALVECFDPQNTSKCKIESACALRHALMQATIAFYRVLDNYSLNDLLHPKAQLSALLDIPTKTA
ncbi:Rrf2 family transcriptional regulator [Thalassospira alkalitolerans]|uniref:Rrf2 family transcriptional regulator n=1 Tax=Thalassospira alkalitolerans TaxID=1293890 RepID=UPI0030EBDC6F|tara:strand:- start:34349 stop:34798 length:450 start_codon:yes stop_codon:yes gene_type:complete